MSTSARPQVSVRQFHPAAWAGWAMVAVDILALEAAFGLGLAARRLVTTWLPAGVGPTQYLGVAIGLLLLPLIHYQIGLYPGFLLGPVERFRRRTLCTLAVFGGLVAWDNLVSRGVISRGVLLATLLFALVLPPLAEMVMRRSLMKRGRWGMPVVMIGCGPTGRSLAKALVNDLNLGLSPVAFLDNRAETWNTVVEGVPVIGPLGLAPDFESRVGAAILSLSDLDQEDVAELLRDLSFPRLIVVPDLAGIAGLWVSARDIGGRLGLEIKKNLLLRRNQVIKVTMDRLIALPLFVLSVPVIAAAAIWIKVVSRGPVFFRQLREGFEGQKIGVWKLRTMHDGADRVLSDWLEEHPEDQLAWKRYYKLRHDPRVLPVIGPLLRRTSLDELPQLWSVLKGEMSLVGPRPLPDYHLDQFSPEFRALRTRVAPGLTGLWQVSARSDGDSNVLESMDSFYIRNWSPWLDLYILVRTVAAVLLARGAY